MLNISVITGVYDISESLLCRDHPEVVRAGGPVRLDARHYRRRRRRHHPLLLHRTLLLPVLQVRIPPTSITCTRINLSLSDVA